ncbi:MAG: aldo/keto reductase [Chitinophagaceae bacterium]|nr:aldo/keto reductase [Chitinophagaceae bacterium]
MITSDIIAGTMKWGIWGAQFTLEEYAAMIEKCIDLGVTTFDHADIYGHYTVEEDFGNALSRQPHLRKKIQIITKCGIRMVTPNRPAHLIKSYDTGKAHIIESVHNSLKNFQTDYLDMLLIHRPDPLMDPYELAEVFGMLQNQGKVLEFGVSNFDVPQVQMVHSFFPVAANQVEISIVKLDAFTDGTLSQCIREKITPMAWSPLGGGKFFDADDDRNKRILAVAQILSEKYDASPDQVLLAWLFKHPAAIKPVLGTVKIERIQKAMEASKIKLTREEWFLLWRASTGKEVA